MPIPVHIALDLESYSKRPSALVLSVGLAAFTLQGGLVGTFYVEPNKEEQRAAGRDEDPATVAWWESQNEAAREVLKSPGVSIDKSLAGIRAFFSRFQDRNYRVAGVWGWGADFDNAMLQDLFRHFDEPPPYDYRVNRCGRTIVEMLGAPKPVAHGTHHNAVDDAIYQAERIRQALLRLREPA